MVTWLGLSYYFINFPHDGIDKVVWQQDRSQFLVGVRDCVNSGEGVIFRILGTRVVGDEELELCEKECPSSLPRV